MGVVIPHRAIEKISTAADPKKAIQELAGDITDFKIFGDRVLVGIYARPEKTKGGIIRPDANKEEDVWQGKVGLVLKMGGDAFRNPETGEPYEDRAEVGDWVVCYIGDGRPIQVGDMPCRIFRDTTIVGVRKDPMSIL
jgi:co-chaperonin GroES (HSP10)